MVAVHGGPGVSGMMAPVARRLADSFRVLEPLQRGSGEEPLTVGRHVEDLQELVLSTGERPAVVGHSWGAMLALAWAAEHPESSRALALVACGTFDRRSRERMLAVYQERLDDRLRWRLARLSVDVPDPDERLRVTGELILPAYSCDLAGDDLEIEDSDARAHLETWRDMVRLQEQGVYPAAFSAITAPVLMLHGAVDPHPGGMIRASLAPYLPQLEYREWAECGHYPWLERAVREEFFAVLSGWLRQAGSEGDGADSG